MEINSLRIRCIAERVAYETMADIGTDHAFIPIAALRIGVAKKAVACDLRAGPLERARQNICACGLESQIETRLGYGLDPLCPGEAETITIGGMGGMLMSEIFEQGRDVAASACQLVLQPQRDIPHVRKAVHRIGFRIEGESIVAEANQFYFVLDCRNGDDAAYSERDYMFGRFLPDEASEVYKDYLAKQMKEHETLLLRLEGSSEAVEQKKQEIIDQIRIYEGLLR